MGATTSESIPILGLYTCHVPVASKLALDLLKVWRPFRACLCPRMCVYVATEARASDY